MHMHERACMLRACTCTAVPHINAYMFNECTLKHARTYELAHTITSGHGCTRTRMDACILSYANARAMCWQKHECVHARTPVHHHKHTQAQGQARTRTDAHTQLCVSVNPRKHERICSSMHMRVHSPTLTQTRTYTHTRTYVHEHAPTRRHTYMHACTHTHTHAHALTHLCTRTHLHY